VSRWRINEILDEIQEKRNRLNAGHSAWYDEGEDASPEAMAECDPSDQFCLGEEIDALKKELKDLIDAL
jgi:hypothetical protein